MTLHDPHAYEFISEAMALVYKQCPHVAIITPVEVVGCNGIDLHPLTGMIRYDPVLLMEVCLNDLCNMIHGAFGEWLDWRDAPCVIAPTSIEYLH